MAKKSNVNIPMIQVIRIIIFLFIGFVLFISYTKMVSFLTSSALFTVRDVLIDTSIQFIDVDQMRRLKGRNIFSVDIKRLENRIRAQYPQIAQLRVMRELPDRIKVLAKKREAVFQIPWKGKFLLVDGSGVAMYNTPVAVDLPMVVGAMQDKAKVVLGAALTDKPVGTALQVIRGFKSRPHTSRLKITSVDVYNPSRIDVALGDTLHVILEQEKYNIKLNMLEMLVTQRKIDFSKVKYIDLRFNEPVLGDNTKSK